MNKNFINIYELTNEIRKLLEEVDEDERDCNEGSLCMHYETIKNLLDRIDKQWFLYMHIWEVDDE